MSTLPPQAEPQEPQAPHTARMAELGACAAQELAARVVALEEQEARVRAELGTVQAELARAIHERDRFEALFRERCRRAQEPMFAPAPRPPIPQAPSYLEAQAALLGDKDAILANAARAAQSRASRSPKARP